MPAPLRCFLTSSGITRRLFSVTKTDARAPRRSAPRGAPLFPFISVLRDNVTPAWSLRDGGQVSLRVIACRRARAAGRGQPAGFRAVFCPSRRFRPRELQHGQTLLGALHHIFPGRGGRMGCPTPCSAQSRNHSHTRWPLHNGRHANEPVIPVVRGVPVLPTLSISPRTVARSRSAALHHLRQQAGSSHMRCPFPEPALFFSSGAAISRP